MGVISGSSNLRHLSSDKKMGWCVGVCWKARVARGRKRERGGGEGGTYRRIVWCQELWAVLVLCVGQSLRLGYGYWMSE